MKNILLLISIIIVNISCENKRKVDIAEKCNNRFVNEELNVEICLPNEKWTVDLIQKRIVLNHLEKDSIPINNSVFVIMVDDYTEHLSSKSLRDKHLKSLLASSTLNAELKAKGKEILDNKPFYDYLVITGENEEIYLYFLFYTNDNYGYILNGNIGNEMRNGVNKVNFIKF